METAAMEYVRVRDKLGRVERYVVLNDDYDRVGAIEPTQQVVEGEERKCWHAIDRNGESQGVWLTRADAAEVLLR